jgi:beta-exotoxin I transport system ATP-binding protein
MAIDREYCRSMPDPGSKSSRYRGRREEGAVVDVAIRTEALVKDYGQTRGLDGLDLEVAAGEVFGYLGPNGAGKSTTIRILIDLIRPTSGSVRVLGLDPRRDGTGVRRRIGYLADDFVVDGRQTGRQLLTYLGNLRGGVPASRIDELADRLDLDLTKKIKTLSRGNRQKVGVVQAFMHEPELLVLDEPTSGLDPFLQHEFAAMVRQTVAGGRTVFMSSHVMSEVQRMADRVGIIRHGKLTAVEHVDQLRHMARRRVEIVFDDPIGSDEFAAIPELSDVVVEDGVLRCVLDGRADGLVKAAARHDVVSITSDEPELEELFFDLYNDPAGHAP